MKTFTTQEIRDLYNRFFREEISFTRMVEIMNERMSESEVSEFKDGDFVVGFGCIFIVHRQLNNYSAEYYVLYAMTNGKLWYDKIYWQRGGIDKLKLALEEEKQVLLDVLAKKGKRWNEEKKCIEDIPKPKFKVGDKVRIKEGVSNKTHGTVCPFFNKLMDDFIGITMTVDGYYRNNYVKCEEMYWSLREEWLEPYVEELKKGDLAIFWDSDQSEARIGVYNQFYDGSPFPHEDHIGNGFKNAVKFESKKHFKRLLKGEI